MKLMSSHKDDMGEFVLNASPKYKLQIKLYNHQEIEFDIGLIKLFESN
jgi:hypothetical protein